MESIGSSAFWACSELKSFIIPSSVKEIGDCAFRFCTNLTSLTNLSPTPQAIDLNTFNSYDGIDLYVLKGCKEAYQNAEVWKNFGTIQEIVDVTGIEEKPALAEEFDVYDLNGRKVLDKATSLDGLSNGVYIVNGKKIVVKK